MPPSQPASLFGGHLRQFWSDRTGFLTRQAALGDVSFIQMGRQPFYFVNHPDLLRDLLVVNAHKFIKGRALQRAKGLLGEGLLTSEGAAHLRHRRMIQPAFHRTRIAEYARWMVKYADEMAAGWEDGATRDIDHDMMHLTLQIVGRTLFDADVADDADRVGRAMTTIVGLFNFLMLPFSEWLEKLPLPQTIRFDKARRTLDEVVYGIINERRRSGDDHGDLLSMLLLARDEDDGGSMTDEQVRDEALTLILAGHETTANALTWTWYLLSQHLAVEAALHHELDTVLAGRTPAFDDVPGLRYTEQVLAESMRLYPPAWAIGRFATEEHEMNGFQIPKGSLILTSPYVMQRDLRFWESPDEFKPERWARQSVKEATQKYIYFPFGGGVRRCIGESFAWSEGILLLAAIAQKWKLSLTENQRVDVKALLTLRPRYGMRMTVERRVMN